MQWFLGRHQIQGRIGEDPVHIVRSIKWVISPGVCILQLPTLEQHDRNIDSTIPRSCYSSAHAVEIILVKAGQVEPGLPVPCQARSTPYPWVGLAVFDSSPWLILPPFRGFPSPQPEK